MGWQRRFQWASVVIMPYFPATGVQLLRYYELTAFSFKWRLSAVLDFKMFKILTAGPVWRAKHAKFRVHCLNCCEYMTVFRLFKMAASRHLGFLKVQNLTYRFDYPIRKSNMHLHAIFCANRLNVCRDMADFRFFNVAAVRHLGFVLRVFGPPSKTICWSLSLCKIWLESVQ